MKMPKIPPVLHSLVIMIKDVMLLDSRILRELMLWPTLPQLVFPKEDSAHALNNLLTTKPKSILNLSQSSHRNLEEITRLLGIRPENTTKKLDILTSISTPLWKPTLSKPHGNVNITPNVNAMVPYGMVLLRDSMIRNLLPLSKTSDTSKLLLRTLVIATGPLVILPSSEVILIQAALRHASARTSLYTCQTCALKTVKNAYALVTLLMDPDWALPRSHLTSRDTLAPEVSPSLRSRREVKVWPARLIHSVELTQTQKRRMTTKLASVITKRECSTETLLRACKSSGDLNRTFLQLLWA